jgi:hypothetical protein
MRAEARAASTASTAVRASAGGAHRRRSRNSRRQVDLPRRIQCGDTRERCPTVNYRAAQKCCNRRSVAGGRSDVADTFHVPSPTGEHESAAITIDESHAMRQRVSQLDETVGREEVSKARRRINRRGSTTPLRSRAAPIGGPVSPKAMSRPQSAYWPPRRRGKSAFQVRYPPLGRQKAQAIRIQIRNRLQLSVLRQQFHRNARRQTPGIPLKTVARSPSQLQKPNLSSKKWTARPSRFLDSRYSPRRVERGECAFVPARQRYLALN